MFNLQPLFQYFITSQRKKESHNPHSILSIGRVTQKDKEEVCFTFDYLLNISSARKKREIYVPKRESGRRGKKSLVGITERDELDDGLVCRVFPL